MFHAIWYCFHFACVIVIAVERLEQLFRALATREMEGGEESGAADHPRVLEEVSMDGIVKHILKISDSSHREFVRFLFVLCAVEKGFPLLAICREEDFGDDWCWDINLYVCMSGG